MGKLRRELFRHSLSRGAKLAAEVYTGASASEPGQFRVAPYCSLSMSAQERRGGYEQPSEIRSSINAPKSVQLSKCLPVLNGFAQDSGLHLGLSADFANLRLWASSETILRHGKGLHVYRANQNVYFGHAGPGKAHAPGKLCEL